MTAAMKRAAPLGDDADDDDDELRLAFLSPMATPSARPQNPVVSLLEAAQSPRPVQLATTMLKKRKHDMIVKPVPKRAGPPSQQWRPSLPPEIDQASSPSSFCCSYVETQTKFSRLALGSDPP
ncbi:hypothetical protein SPRG_02695 [Saprolegnia parasitica CBS 223.65]|uniref:Uncharacterized protein n=1 Tax=Saprolegnia parasitica (strain CBS 223.65) TaxID=695850 RepID=A0A067CQM5_SAPPC|nr:hypothetical protein SPRG_02695 [Saprolegnia parasitica CBS 223.65]KDO33004.1 hypothetical protein SPRG_02695 [Saprolegnia parasitica CBS 223.65]|eukprot:XP_012196648.1 hypothetical protein SPRG_02695 [Saprolegnia parasitica CBS 223.65]